MAIEAMIYLDNQATTQVDPRVLNDMEPFWMDVFGNPHSTGHAYGWNAAEAVQEARTQIADAVGCDEDGVIFTSGATESCNAAIRGVAQRPKRSRRQIVTVATEHPCVWETCSDLEKDGFDVVRVPVKPSGLVDWRFLDATINEETLLVTVMLVNNEIGVIQPIQSIAKLCAERGALCHTDATQALGKCEIDIRNLGVDLLSLSAHKAYGPKGVGALCVARRDISLEPILTGGGQERSLRAGTIPVPLVVGFGKAAQLAVDELDRDREQVSKYAYALESTLHDICGDVTIHGDRECRVPGNLSVGFGQIRADDLMVAIGSEIAVSTGSACASGGSRSSRVLRSIGLSQEEADSVVRFSIGRFNQLDEISQVRQCIKAAIHRL